MNCPVCQYPTEHGAHLCPNCGFDLTTELFFVPHEDLDATEGMEPLADYNVPVTFQFPEPAAPPASAASPAAVPAAVSYADISGLDRTTTLPLPGDTPGAVAGQTARINPGVVTAPQAGRAFRAEIPSNYGAAALPPQSEGSRYGIGSGMYGGSYVAQRRNEVGGSYKRSGSKIAGVVLGLLALLVLLGGAVAMATYSMEMWGGHTIPSVQGLSADEARAKLQQAGFNIKVTEEYSDDAAGKVLRTMPEAGGRAEAGTLIMMYVGKARTIPDVVGVNEEAALQILNETGYTRHTVEVMRSNTADDGTVITTDPLPGVAAKSDTEIKVFIAQSYKIPKVEGLTAEQAQSLLEQEGYVVTVEKKNNEEKEEGTVLGTNPPADTKLDKGNTVVLYVSHKRGPELIELTQKWFKDKSKMNINNQNCELVRVESVTYDSDNICTFKVLVKPYEIVYKPFGLPPETAYGPEETIPGKIEWNDDNKLVSVDPKISDV